jgi:hypothetical protein
MRNESSLPFHDPAGLGIFLLMAKALAPAPFQPDFRARCPAESEIRRSTVREPKPDAGEKAGTTSESPAPRKIGFLERLDRRFWAQQQRDLEAYLAQSADIHDLEQRMKNLERGAWYRYN